MRILTLILLSLSFSRVAWADEGNPHVTWVGDDFPPIFIQKGPMKGQGFIDLVVKDLTARLSGYSHRVEHLPISRTLQEMRVRDGVCSAGLLRSEERAAYLAFSRPVLTMLGNRLISLADKGDRFRAYLNDAGAIDLDALLQDRNLVVGYTGVRFYGAPINRFLAAHRGADADRKHEVDMPNAHYARLLIHGRIDYTFGQATETAYQFEMEGKRSAYVSFAIAGLKNQVPVSIACSDKPFGRQVVADVNRLLADNSGIIKLYQGYYERWLDPRALQDIRHTISARSEKDPNRTHP